MRQTRYDYARGCFVAAGDPKVSRPPGCKCHPDSPFLWKNHTGPTIFTSNTRELAKSEADVARSISVSLRLEEKRRDGNPLDFHIRKLPPK